MCWHFQCDCHVVSFPLQATINIIFDRVGKVDPVTRGIEIAVNYVGIQFDVSSCFAIMIHGRKSFRCNYAY